MMRTALIAGCSAAAGALATTGTALLVLNLSGAAPVGSLWATPSPLSSSCPNTGLDLDEADRLHRDFMRGHAEPMTEGKRF